MKVESIQDWIMPANERINVAYIHIGYGLFNIRSVECKVKMAVCHTTLYSVYRLLIGKMIADNLCYRYRVVYARMPVHKQY